MTPADIVAMRTATGLSQRLFAARYRLTLRSLQAWEQGRRVPDSGSTLLLRLIEAHPDSIAVMIAGLTYQPCGGTDGVPRP